MEAQAARHGAAGLGVLLAQRVPALRRDAALLAVELGDLSSGAGRLAAAGERCSEELQKRMAVLREQLEEAHAENVRRTEAALQREAIVKEEVRALEQRIEGRALDGAASGPTWLAQTVEQCEALRARVVAAERRLEDAERRDTAECQLLEERLAMLGEDCCALELREAETV